MDPAVRHKRAGAFVPTVTDGVMNGFAVLLLALIGAIVLQVVCSFFDLNPVATFTETWPLVGDALTLNSLLDLQWHALAIIALLPCAIVWMRDGHVRVDFLYSQYSDRGRRAVDLVGNLALALPFLLISLPAAYRFAERAFTTGEQSRNGGLNDLYLIKAVLPLGFSLLLIAVLVECVRLIRGQRS